MDGTRDFRQGFFSSAAATEAIDAVSHDPVVTLFLGAGVSADQNVAMWTALVRDLLQQRLRLLIREEGLSVHAEELSADFVAAYLQLPGASLVDQLFQKQKLDSTNRARDRAIQRAIYKGNRQLPLERPALSREVVLLAAQLKALGRDVHIVSTNYDLLIENWQQYDKSVGSTLRKLGVQLVSVPNEAPVTDLENLKEFQLPVVHIHGVVPPRGSSQDVVFSEADYVRWMTQGQYRDYLFQRLDRGSTLMIGTSLSDYNIITYLKRATGSSARRFALMPAQGDRALITLPDADITTMAALQDLRASSLGITLLHPDFFGQSSQFLHEVTLAARKTQSVAANKLPKPKPYVDRVALWWSKFEKKSYAKDRVRQEATMQLQQFAARLRREVKEAEHVKLEVWVRANFKVNEDPRILEEWCSSQSMWLSQGTHWPHQEALSVSNLHPAVSAFSSRGVAEGAVRHRTDDRWTHYLSSVIVLEEDPYYSVPVGVVSALFSAPSARGADYLKSLDGPIRKSSLTTRRAHISRLLVEQGLRLLRP